MYIMYLSVKREGQPECKCGIFIINAESLLCSTTVVFRSRLFFRYFGFLFNCATFVALRFLFFHKAVCSHTNYH